MARYLTTTLPYVNAEPHIGFATELIQADTLARLWRAKGEQVFFSTGTDEHGQKIFEAAQKAGKGTQEYVDYYVSQFEKLHHILSLTNDGFIRTTELRHIEAAQEMWRRAFVAGDIYKKTYTGTYCVGCEAYKTEKDLDAEGRCVDHPHMEVQILEEENYFFRLSSYQEALVTYLSKEGSVVPEWRRLEALAFVEGGLEDISISREKEKLSWGIPVPGDDTQVMYVWFDALTDYLSTLGWPKDEEGMYKKFWEEGYTVQLAGKDQVRFQSILWQAMLFSAGIKHTDTIFYHGFITSGGQKMSKSLGNVIHPYGLVEKYGTEATRYVLIRHVHPTQDSDVTRERLDEWYTAHLVNGLGNLVARVMNLAEVHLPAPVVLTHTDTCLRTAYLEKLEAYEFQEALDFVFEIVGECDGIMTAKEPFKKVKSIDEGIRQEGIEDIEHLVHHLAVIATHLAHVMPQTSERILSGIAQNKKPENLFPRLT